MVAIVGLPPTVLLHERSLAEFAGLFAPLHIACDTGRRTLPDGRIGYVVTFAPVMMLDQHSVIEANVIGDTVRSLLVRLIPHVKGLRTFSPKAPYSTRNMGTATIDDLNAFGKLLASEYGEPSVSTETYLVYFGNDKHPSINVNLKDEMITMEITPTKY